LPRGGRDDAHGWLMTVDELGVRDQMHDGEYYVSLRLQCQYGFFETLRVQRWYIRYPGREG
jgi:hypothetical protein